MSCPAHYVEDVMKGPPVCKKTKKVKADISCPKLYDVDTSTMMCRKGKNKEQSPSLVCPGGFELVHDYCIWHETQPHVASCPPGFRFDGHQTCSAERLGQAQGVCPKGSHLDHTGKHCTKRTTFPVEQICPDGYRMEGSFCAMTKRISAELVCEDGFQPSISGQCARVEILEPELVCPEGTVLRPVSANNPVKSTKATDYWCVGENMVNPKLECPPSTQKLQNGLGELICKQIKEVAAQLECPQGFFDDRGTCTKFYQTSKRPLCPEQFKFSFGQCIKNLAEAPVTLCPITYKLLDGVCVKEINTKPQPVCPIGYKFDALTSRCYDIEESLDIAENPKPEVEQLLDLDPPEEEQLLDLEPPAPQPPPQIIQQPAPQVTVIQQPIPIPQPMTMLPPQRPMPIAPPAPQSYPVPYPVPVIQEKQVAVPVEHTRVVKTPVFIGKKKKHHGKYQ
eukprot:GHVN01050851.1.p1 GENE.GHVN01050851.1~~GHVN01050851.1.p1  ORF type:complete len:484 (-),score=50.84 GHVN01050851.1:176-1525(-)